MSESRHSYRWKPSGLHSSQDASETVADRFFSDHFDFSKNYGESLAIFTAISCFATMHPSIMLCGATYFYAKYYIDMYQITRQYSRSPIQYSNRASSTTHILLWSAVIANVFNFLYFWDLETGTSGTHQFLGLIIVLNYLLMRVHSGCKGLIPKFLQVRMKRAHLRKLQGQEWAEEGSDVRPPSWSPSWSPSMRSPLRCAGAGGRDGGAGGFRLPAAQPNDDGGRREARPCGPI